MVLGLKKKGIGYGVWGMGCFASLLLGCVEYDRDNPLDPGSPLYAWQTEPSSVSQEPIYCSSSVLDYVPSSSSVEAGSSSEGAPSSSVETDNYPSSSSNAPLSSSIASSSSSPVPPSSSSVEQSSSSLAPSSSSSAPSSSSLAPSTNVLEDSRDSKTYRTVVIGTQTWMAENLNHNAAGSKCYSNQESNCDKYGRLYNWATAMSNASSSTAVPSGVRGVCPEGWHLPSQAEWEVMTAYIGGASTEGKKLKATSGWNSSGNGTDEYGFSALPGGYGYSDGSFNNVGYRGNWWSASEDNSNLARSRLMNYYDEGATWGSGTKSSLFSVRCVQD